MKIASLEGHNSLAAELRERSPEERADIRKFVDDLIAKGKEDPSRPMMARSTAELRAFDHATAAGRPMNVPTLARLTRT